jgi:hypothetical protein
LDIRSVNNLKLTSISNMQKELKKKSSDQDKGDEESFNAIESNLQKQEAPQAKKRATPVVNGQGTKALSDTTGDALKRALLFMDRK